MEEITVRLMVEVKKDALEFNIGKTKYTDKIDRMGIK